MSASSAETLKEVDEYIDDSLVKICLAFLINPAASNLQSNLQSYAERNNVAGGVLKKSSKLLLIFLQRCMKDGLSAAQVKDRCDSIQLSEKTCAAISDNWTHSSSSMINSLLSRTITSNKLVDLDWTFGVTAATDDCDQVGKTFLQLKLTIDEGDSDDTKKAVFVELSLEQFYSFLGNLETCKNYVDYLGSEMV